MLPSPLLAPAPGRPDPSLPVTWDVAGGVGLRLDKDDW